MFGNDTLTIYNKYFNQEKREIEYRPTHINGVHWYTEQKTQLDAGKGSVKSADLYKIRIYPESHAQSRTYIDAREYQRLSIDKVDKYWTVDNGDYIAKGIMTCSCQDLIKMYTQVGRVNSFSDNRKKLIPHIRIGGAA